MDIKIKKRSLLLIYFHVVSSVDAYSREEMSRIQERLVVLLALGEIDPLGRKLKRETSEVEVMTAELGLWSPSLLFTYKLMYNSPGPLQSLSWYSVVDELMQQLFIYQHRIRREVLVKVLGIQVWTPWASRCFSPQGLHFSCGRMGAGKKQVKD